MTQSLIPASGTSIAGDLAHDAVDSGNPVKIGGKATLNPTPVAGADRTDALFDTYGILVTRGYATRANLKEGYITITSSTTETTLVVAQAGTYLDLVSLVVVNTSATAVRVDIRDATGGSVVMSVYVPAGDMRGFNFTIPKPQATSNNNWTAQCSASVSDVRIYAMTVKYVA